MRREKSCGAVIWHGADDDRVYLIERMRKGHTSLCKGHMEGAETEHETSTREIREETGLSVRYVEGFRETIEYSPYPECVKKVVFFLAEAEDTETVPQPEEVRALEWLPLDEALRVLTHESDRDVLRKADRFLNDLG